MKWLRDLGITILVVAGIIAIPFVAAIGLVAIVVAIVGGVGWFIYACVHDERLKKEEASSENRP